MIKIYYGSKLSINSKIQKRMINLNDDQNYFFADKTFGRYGKIILKL